MSGHFIPTSGHGSIYEIVSPNGMRYIGSTLAPIADRLFYHIRDYKIKPASLLCCSARVFRDAGGPENCVFRVIAEYPNCTRDELNGYEAQMIVNTPCINTTLPSRSVPLFKQARK